MQENAYMRRHTYYALIAALIAAAPAVPAHANPVEFLDRIVTFAERTLSETLPRSFLETGADPKGPPPFRVGLMLPKSGGLREAAERVARGWEIALQMSDNHVVERPVRLVLVDTSQGLEETLVAASAMLEKPGIDVFAGVVGAHTAAAMARFTGQRQKPLIIAGAIGADVMSQACYPHVARTSFNIAPYQTTSGRFFATKYKTLVSVGPDTKGGHRIVRRFVKAYRKAGGRIIEQAWATTGRKYDWSALLARSIQGGPQAIYAFYQGKNAERIVHQYSRNGTKRQAALIGPEWLFGPRVINRRGKHAKGLRFLTSYLPERDTSANTIFVAAYRKAYSEDPDSYAYMGYENAMAVLLTAADLGGQVQDGAAFIAAMKKVSFAGLMPRGDFSLNQTNSAFLKRLYWVEVVHNNKGTRLKRLNTIPIDPDNSTCKKQTARNAN
ncbi:MAG: branched-chain amino acid transport system substrate-binding protein [Paracoccaceae bacterium]|jgi:branched-chain amino acid transport system substrate-binding protein